MLYQALKRCPFCGNAVDEHKYDDETISTIALPGSAGNKTGDWLITITCAPALLGCGAQVIGAAASPKDARADAILPRPEGRGLSRKRVRERRSRRQTCWDRSLQ